MDVSFDTLGAYAGTILLNAWSKGVTDLYMGYLRARLVIYCIGLILYESGAVTGEELSVNLYNTGDATVYCGQTGPDPMFGSRLVTKLTK